MFSIITERGKNDETRMKPKKEGPAKGPESAQCLFKLILCYYGITLTTSMAANTSPFSALPITQKSKTLMVAFCVTL